MVNAQALSSRAKLAWFLLLLPALAAEAAEPPKALIEDTFEPGHRGQWALVSDGVRIVAEDANRPTGNHVARFTGPGQVIAGPLVAPGDWRAAAKLDDELDAWDDYRLSFRFRAGRIPEVPATVRGRAILFRVLWRVNPAEDNPHESYGLEFRWNRANKDWEFAGPLATWAGREDRVEALDEMGPAGGKADTKWHTVAITVRGDTFTTMFDGDFHARVRDTRIAKGVIAIRSAWSASIDPGWLEVDDIRVEPLGDSAGGARLSPTERLRRAMTRGCLLAYMPSRNVLYASFDFGRSVVYDRSAVAAGRAVTAARVQLLPKGGGRALAERLVTLTGGTAPQTAIPIPPLNGEYVVRFTLQGPNVPAAVGKAPLEKPLLRTVFPWEGNRLGITDEIYPPFTPVRVAGRQVDVVERRCTMNGFGLWDSVISCGRELLAGPMALRYVTDEGEGQWDKSSVAAGPATPQSAAFEAKAVSNAVRVAASSTIEFDGCMKVRMTLAPGDRPREIRRLWIEIPLRDAEMPLYHTYVDGIRINPAGRTPRGKGVVWQSGQANRRDEWQNSFCSYIWLGAERRGLAWFAENDRGWLTAKDGGKLPVQDLVRDGNRLVLRVYLVNTPSVLREPRELVFGLQASPVKPMPENWRARGNAMPAISGPVSPWGGLSCSYKGPYGGDWSVIDRIAAAHKTGQLDANWLDAYVAKHDPPPVHGTWDWKASILKFVNKWAVPRRPRPALVYAEEMAACRYQPPWWTFQDEWTILAAPTQRECRTDDEFRKGPTGGGARVTFPRSYQDYALWYHDQWLRRGIGLYWDNCHAIASTNLHNSAAYVAENGKVQPALILWNQRDYMRRAWNLLQYWKRHQEDEVEWSVHRTNCQLLPLHGWATASLDLEWSARYAKPFPPEEVRTTTMGQQTGVFGHVHRTLWGKSNPIMLDWAREHPTWPNRASWGMRMVHELSLRTAQQAVYVGNPGAEAARALEKIVEDFGYATPAVTVHNYWTDSPAAAVSGEQVKWIVLAKPAKREVMLVLANWSDKPQAVRVRLGAKVLGFAPGGAVADAETGEPIATVKDDEFPMEVPAVYGVRVVTVH